MNAAAATFTAAHLALTMWGEDIETIAWGVYEGTSIPVRRVPADAVLTVEATRYGWRITDSDGGWIADRFGAIRVGQHVHISGRHARALGLC